MAVVAAVELEDYSPTRHPTRKTHRRHHSLRAGTDGAHHVETRHERDEPLGERHLVGRRDAERCAQPCARRDRPRNLRTRMAEDHRAPATTPVRQLAPVRRADARALPRLHEHGRSAHSVECPHRAVHAAGDRLPRPLEQHFVLHLFSFHAHIIPQSGRTFHPQSLSQSKGCSTRSRSAPARTSGFQTWRNPR